MMKALMLGAALGLAAATAALAQPAPQVPTTKLLAIGSLPAGVDQAKVRQILPAEVRATVQLYLDGKLDQWFSRTDQPGVVFVLNVTDPKAAHEMLEALPLGQAKLMNFELIPLGPLNPLRQLIGPQAPPAAR